MTTLVRVRYGRLNVAEAPPGGYVYRYTGAVPLDVGDVVMVPPTPYSEDAQEATVTEIDVESTYQGYIKAIMYRVSTAHDLDGPPEDWRTRWSREG